MDWRARFTKLCPPETPWGLWTFGTRICTDRAVKEFMVKSSCCAELSPKPNVLIKQRREERRREGGAGMKADAGDDATASKPGIPQPPEAG